MEVNPFYHSGPVTGKNFADRRDELETLLRWLGTTPPTCVALYGPERIGKTSLLRQLCEAEGPGHRPDYRWVYLDLQGIFSPEEFWKTGPLGMGDEGEATRALETALWGPHNKDDLEDAFRWLERLPETVPPEAVERFRAQLREALNRFRPR
jgi:GTPase SAR1 family protein